MTTITSHFTGKIAAIKEAGMSSGPQWHALHLGPCPGCPSRFCGLTPVMLHAEVRCPHWAWWASLSVCSASHFPPTVSSLWNPFQSGFCPKQSSYHACVVLHFAKSSGQFSMSIFFDDRGSRSSIWSLPFLWTLFSFCLGQLLLSLFD